jgi:transcriptional regulator of acetoin/glycerol metabolism
VSDDAIRLFMLYDFPGNIRELENIIEHAFVMCGGDKLDIEHLPKELREAVMTASFNKKPTLHDRFKQSEEDIIKDALQRNLGKRSATAKELGVHTSTLWRKMKQFGLL